MKHLRDESAAHIHRYRTELARLFQSTRTRHDAHEQSRGVMAEMAADPTFVTDFLRAALAKPTTFNSNSAPIIGFPIEINPDYSLIANCWLPLPNRATDLSTKAIHHHGLLLITSTTAFG